MDTDSKNISEKLSNMQTTKNVENKSWNSVVVENMKFPSMGLPISGTTTGKSPKEKATTHTTPRAKNRQAGLNVHEDIKNRVARSQKVCLPSELT
ncbi:hypothetical protein DPMN_116426 [Dreissena polymorpha]|uniref:Uncharacterized protein n=1 Tax=Dreissena polymorpha TaxID=45954 RepID=A0A9D4KPE7_DREPO|nr:hypothetical protein DPMN_116426 [Dreissena polymorpha]